MLEARSPSLETDSLVGNLHHGSTAGSLRQGQEERFNA